MIPTMRAQSNVRVTLDRTGSHFDAVHSTCIARAEGPHPRPMNRPNGVRREDI